MIKRYGLSDKFRNLVFGDDNDEVFVGSSFGQVQSYSDATAADIDKEIQRIITECYEETKRILIEKRAIVEGLAARLIESYKVDNPEFEAIYECGGDLARADELLKERREKAKAEAEAEKAAGKTGDAGDKDAASKALLEATSTIDKATSKGVYHKNYASRKISRLNIAVNKMN